jgi:hypothetical protein
MKQPMKKVLLIIVLLAASTAAAQENLTRLLRQPDIHGDKVAFVYAGDIWIADVRGGDARRLTSDEGVEYFPKFSPDGRQIAFSGEYSGSRQVFVMPVDGGAPKQLTFYNDVGAMPPRGGIDNRILDWTPDGKNILFLPHRLPWSDRMARPYVVPAAGGMETPLAIPEAGGGMYSPDGTKIVYTPIEREFRTWKRYRGGRAQDVWTYDLVRNTAEQLTDTDATENQPVWVGDTILGCALAEQRSLADRLRERRISLALRSRYEPFGTDSHPCVRRFQEHAATFSEREVEHQLVHDLPDWRAGSLRGARRHLHRTGETWRDPQRHTDARRPRDGSGVVA